jgi:acyl-CoA thioesterase-1
MLALPLAAEPVKIITLGDSITKGVRSGVTAEQTFASLLQATLKQNQIDATVQNIGIGGERTDQAL